MLTVRITSYRRVCAVSVPVKGSGPIAFVVADRSEGLPDVSSSDHQRTSGPGLLE